MGENPQQQRATHVIICVPAVIEPWRDTVRRESLAGPSVMGRARSSYMCNTLLSLTYQLSMVYQWLITVKLILHVDGHG